MAIGFNNNNQWRAGSADTRPVSQPRNEKQDHVSNAASLKMGTWNCAGLSKMKKNMATKLDLDILCLTENHKWRDDDVLTIYSDIPPNADSWSGVSLTLSKRLAKCIITSGNIGSRIAFCRLRGKSRHLFVIGIYIPQRQRSNPSQEDTYTQLETLLAEMSRQDCVIVMGDFNSGLSRNEPGYVGRWCIHSHRDTGGDRLLQIMKSCSLRACSTYFQPRRNHNNATYMNVQPDKPPSQIDYVLVSTRWSSSVRASKTSWGISIDVHGRKYDHALVQIIFKTRLKCSRKASRKDFTALKQPEIAVAHQDQLQNSLESTPLPTTATEQWKRLSSALHSAQSTLPKVSLKQTRKWETSVNTTKLIERRKRTWENMSKTEQADLKREISRSARNDYREYIGNIVEDMEKADSVGNYSEVFKLSKRVSSRKGNAFTQPSKDHLGNTITSTEQTNKKRLSQTSI